MSLAMQCESCGRPLASREEHGAQNLDNPYCIHCTDMKGKLLPFEKLYEDMVASAMQTRWMNKEQAEKYALEEMGRWPAWKDRVDKILRRYQAILRVLRFRLSAFRALQPGTAWCLSSILTV